MTKTKKESAYTALLTACRAVLKFSGGTNIMGEPLCPICGRPEKHRKDCPFPKVAAAVAKTELGDEEEAKDKGWIVDQLPPTD